MEGLKVLCRCCKKQHCEKEIVIIDYGDCKIIKCLQFEKDESKITPPEKFPYVVRSEEI